MAAIGGLPPIHPKGGRRLRMKDIMNEEQPGVNGRNSGTCYYVVLHRPVGSNTWTPFPISEEENPARNFFASWYKANAFIAMVVGKGYGVYLHGEKRVVGVELAVGEVVLNYGEPIVTVNPPYIRRPEL